MKVFLVAIYLMANFYMLFSDVKSLDGKIDFFPHLNNTSVARLNDSGLGVGVAPEAKLHVNGNAIISKSLMIGSSRTSTNDNLFIQGTVSFNIETLEGGMNQTVSEASYQFIDASDNITIFLPNPDEVSGRKLTIKNINRQTNILIGYSFLDQQAPYLTCLEGDSLGVLTLIATDSGWMKLSSFGASVTSIVSSNLRLWYDANDIDGDAISEGIAEAGLTSSNVTKWVNKAGDSDYDLIHSVENPPSYSAVGETGQSEVHFSISDSTMLTSLEDFTLDPQHTLIIAGNLFLNNSREYLLSVNTDNYYIGRTNSSGGGLVYIHGGTPISYPSPSEPEVLMISSDNINAQYKIQNESQILNTSDVTNIDGANLSPSEIVLGSRKATNYHLGSSSDIYEILYYDYILSDRELNLIRESLKAKWNIVD